MELRSKQEILAEQIYVVDKNKACVAVEDYLGISARQPCGTVRDAYGVVRAVCTEKADEMASACRDCMNK